MGSGCRDVVALSCKEISLEESLIEGGWDGVGGVTMMGGFEREGSGRRVGLDGEGGDGSDCWVD